MGVEDIMHSLQERDDPRLAQAILVMIAATIKFTDHNDLTLTVDLSNGKRFIIRAVEVQRESQVDPFWSGEINNPWRLN